MKPASFKKLSDDGNFPTENSSAYISSISSMLSRPPRRFFWASDLMYLILSQNKGIFNQQPKLEEISNNLGSVQHQSELLSNAVLISTLSVCQA